MNLATPSSVQKLQRALHDKAKESPNRRFHALYDKVYRKDGLEWAYVRCRANDGAPGVDRQTFAYIEAYGLDRWLEKQRTPTGEQLTHIGTLFGETPTIIGLTAITVVAFSILGAVTLLPALIALAGRRVEGRGTIVNFVSGTYRRLRPARVS